MATRISQFRRAAPALVDQRQARRHRVSIARVTTRAHGAEPADAILHDLSIYGCRLECNGAHNDGDRLWLRFDGGLPIAATVMWSDADFTGCRFDDPIDHALMRSLTLALC